MAKKSGSKSSRSERRAGRQRAARAREHGLPTARVEPVRARTPDPASSPERDDRSSDAPARRSAKSAGLPPLVWVVGAALVILLGVFLLSHRRDEGLTEATQATAEPPAAPAPSGGEVAAEADASAAPSAQPESAAAAQPAADASAAPVVVDEPTPPTQPVVVAPVVPAPAPPKVQKPAVSAPVRPVVAAPAGVPKAAATPAPPTPAPVATPRASVPMPAGASAPPDNPY